MVTPLFGSAPQPNRPDESQRIRRAGGTIYFYGVWRVGGVLAVSRYTDACSRTGVGRGPVPCAASLCPAPQWPRLAVLMQAVCCDVLMDIFFGGLPCPCVVVTRPCPLARRRAIGDRILKTQGVTAEPEIRQCRVTPADKFLVLASDGLWCVAMLCVWLCGAFVPSSVWCPEPCVCLPRAFRTTQGRVVQR